MVSIIIPTYNEREGIEDVIKDIFTVLSMSGIDGEIIIVDDDSPDKTWEFCEGLKSKYNLQVIRRIGKRGLASAVIDGFASAKGGILGVMDADGSHDPHILPDMIKSLSANECQLAVGSRYIPGGGTQDWPLVRRFISLTAVYMGRFLTSLNDVTSGYCLFRKEILDGVTLDPVGWKIVLEIVIKGNYEKLLEFPFIFKDREKGQSKLSKNAVMNYIQHLMKLSRWMKENNRKRK
jgi:dolichol-phosphate mannosyltransferase